MGEKEESASESGNWVRGTHPKQTLLMTKIHTNFMEYPIYFPEAMMKHKCRNELSMTNVLILKWPKRTTTRSGLSEPSGLPMRQISRVVTNLMILWPADWASRP